VAKARADELKLHQGPVFPQPDRCLEDAFASVATHVRLSLEYWCRVRHTNYLEHLRRDPSAGEGDRAPAPASAAG
jgi:hypothetical protein